MEAHKILTSLFLLGCLFSTATLSPIKGKTDDLISRPSGLFRTKTAVRVFSTQRPSYNSGIYVDPNSSVAHFGTRQFQPSEDTSVALDHTTQQEKSQVGPLVVQQDFEQDAGSVEERTRQNDQQSFQFPGATPTETSRFDEPLAKVSSTSNFGLRIQKNDEESKPSRCYIKGTCSTVSFTPQDKIPSNSRDVTADKTNFDVLNEKVNTEQPEDEDEDGATEEPKNTEDIDQDSETDNDEQISQSNLLGQDSSQGGFSLTQDQVQPFQDGQHKFPAEEAFPQTEFSNEGHRRIVSDQSEGIIPADYDLQTQYENSKDATGGYNTEHQFDGSFVPQNQDTYDGTNEQKTSLSVDFPAKQTLENVPFNQENHQTYGNAEFSEYSGSQDTSAGFITPKDNSQNFQGQQQVLGGSSHSHAKDGSYQEHDDGQYYHYANPIEGLRYSVPGNPGEDYPIFYQIPETSFNCKQQPFSAGIFGDTEASCQVFHVCKENGGQDSFLCPNGTVFNQQYFVCDWWYNFRCSDTPSFYNLNSHLYWDWESFTPSQMMNVPSNNNEGASNYQGGASPNYQGGASPNYHGGASPNYQDGASGSFSSISNHDDSRSPARGIAPGQNQATKSTIAIDNTAIADRNRNNFEQTLHDDAFIQEIAPPNAFQDNNQGFSEQQNKGYPSSFDSDSPSTSGHQPASVSFGSSFENAPESSHFPTNEQDANSYQPASSDTGANRQPDSDAGTRYPDQSGYGLQFTDNFHSQGQNVRDTNILGNHGSVGYGGDTHTRGRPDTQNLVPVSFGDENKPNSFTESYEAVQDNENDYVRNNEQSVPFVTGQQTSFGRNSGGNRDNINQVQEHINAFDENSAGSFGSDEKFGNQNLRGNVDRQDQSIQANQDQTNFPGDNSYVPQNQIIEADSQEPSSDINKQTILKDDSNFNGVNQQDISHSFTGTTRDVSDEYNSHNTENNRVVSDGEGISNIAINNQNAAGSTDDSDDIQSNKDEQEHLSTFEDSRPNSFHNNKDGSFEFQNQNTFTQQHVDTSLKSNVDEQFGNRGSDVNSGNVQGHTQIQQEFVSTSFDDQSVPGTIENDGTFQPGRAFVTNQNDENNQNLQQSHISSSHTGNEASSINRQNTGNRDSNAGFVNIQEGGAPSFQTEDQTSTLNVGSGGNVNAKVDQKVQQEFISSFDENRPEQFDANGGHDIGQRNPIDQSQENSQIQRNGQSTFQRDGIRGSRNPNDNQEIQQERIFDPLNKFSPSTISSNNRDSLNSQEFRGNPNNNEQISNIDTNGNQLLQQQRIASVFEPRKTNNIEQSKQNDDFNRGHQRDDETNNRQAHRDQNFQQDNIFISPDGSIRDDFNSRNKENANAFVPQQDHRILTFPQNEPNFESRNRDQNLGIQNEQQLPLGLHQTGISFPFDETLQNDRRNNVNIQGNVQEGFINNRNQVETVQNNQNNFGNDRQVDNQRTSVSSGVQEHISAVPFDDSRPNSFDSGNDQNRFPQDGFVRIQDQRISFPKNQQNNFGVESNINQENNQRPRENFNQEHVPVSFSGNHPDRINSQNIFNRGENRGNEQSHQQTQSVSFDNRQNFFTNRNNGEYQNANVVFERRLNNFQPTNIHTMSRGGHQDTNYHQQRTSFRPYGHNQQSKGSNPHVQRPQSVLNQNQGTLSAYSNDNSASNRNFFVTNGHQIRDEQPLQIIQNPFSNRQPTNGNQGQAGQYASQNGQGHGQLNSNAEITNSRHEQRGGAGAAPVPVGQENSDSRGNNYDSSSNYRNDKSIDSPLNAEVDARGSPTLFINANDAVAYNQPASAVAQVNYNGWKPIVKH